MVLKNIPMKSNKKVNAEKSYTHPENETINNKKLSWQNWRGLLMKSIVGD